ncbi:MAG TPA: c(7)-type cytochrome triheme domain-containing protein [Geobacteraceae bacterium]
MKKFVIMVVVLLGCAGLAFSQGGVKKKRVLPYEYGNVLIDNYASKAGLNPVVFEHWVHRSKFTCRLCHVDIGFAMKAGETKIKAADNMKGYFCGACHNGKLAVPGKGGTIFAACSSQFGKDDMKRCGRCHSVDKNATERNARREQREQEFRRFAEKMPRERFGNEINWEQAEVKGLVKLTDFLEGVSMKRAALADQKDFSIGSKVEGVPDITFSHKKHTVWNGCEVCHPDIFIGVKRGTDKYSMVELFDGKYCGVCHDKVAFPQTDCQRCHTKPV